MVELVRPAKVELVHTLRDADLLRVPSSELQGACQQLGISARGEREELIERLYHEIWKPSWDAY